MKKSFILVYISIFSLTAWGQTNTFGSSDPNYVSQMYKNIDSSIKYRTRQIYDLPGTSFGCYYAGDPHKHAKDWSNPKLDKKQVQGVIDSGLDLFKETFSESLKTNPALLEKLEGKLSAISTSGCNKHNKCLVKIYSTIETYGRFLKPDLGEDNSFWDPAQCGKKGKSGSKRRAKWAQCDVKVRGHNFVVQQNKYYLDSYKKIKEDQIINGSSLSQAAFEYFQKDNSNLKRYGGQIVRIAKTKSGQANKGITALSLTLKDENKKVQAKMDVFWDRLNNRIKPQAGCAISGQRFASFPLPQQVQLNGIPSYGFTSDDNVDDSCFTEEKLLSTNFIRTDQDAGKSELSAEESSSFKEKLKNIIDAKKDEGFTVTDVQVIGVASKAWSSLKDEHIAKDKNMFLAKQREDVAKNLISGFKSEGVDLNTAHELAGPGYKQSSDTPLAKEELSDKNIKAMYEKLIDDNGKNHLYYVGINSLEEYKKFLEETNERASKNSNDKGVNNLYQLKYRPFQGFKIVIRGHKSSKVPCKDYGKSSGSKSSNTKSSSVIKE